MKYYLTLLLTSLVVTMSLPAMAQIAVDTLSNEDTTTLEDEVMIETPLKPAPKHPHYWSSGLDAGILSGAAFEKPGTNRELSYLRFSLVLNIGYHFNYDFDEHFGMFTGLDIKNIGFTDKTGDHTTKRRVYTIGAPLGFKIGQLQNRNYLFLGGGLDVPFNYREKSYTDRKHKEKFSEWFSDRTPTVMPYLFAGICMKPGVTFKAQFYPSNFFDVDYEETDATGTTYRPYRGYDARLLSLSLGFDIHYRKSEKPHAAE